MNAFVDISEDDLTALHNLAARHAVQREFGTITCAHIMTRDVVTVEFGEDLDTTWQHFEQASARALPVISSGRHVLGMITPTDFLRHSRHGGFQGLGDRLRHLIRRTTDMTSSKPEVAGQIMSRPAITAREDMPIVEVAVQLAGDIRQVAIVDAQDKLTGLVTQSDLIGAMQRVLAARTWTAPNPDGADDAGRPTPEASLPA
jgi:CBS domain-containing membrane protein